MDDLWNISLSGWWFQRDSLESTMNFIPIYIYIYVYIYIYTYRYKLINDIRISRSFIGIITYTIYIYIYTVSTIHIPQDISVVYTVGNNFWGWTPPLKSGIIRVEPITKQQHQQRFGGSWTYEKPCKTPKDPNPSFNFFSRIFLMYLFRDCYKDFSWDIGGYFANEHGDKLDCNHHEPYWSV